MEPVFRNVEEKKVVGIGESFISILSPNKNSDVIIPKLWEQVTNRAGEISAPPSSVWMGLCTQPPDEQRGSDDEFFYIAGREVESTESIPEGMISYTIPAGRYAAFTHKGKLDTLAETVREIHQTWLPTSGHIARADAPEIEIYDERFNPASENSEMEIWVPIEE